MTYDESLSEEDSDASDSDEDEELDKEELDGSRLVIGLFTVDIFGQFLAHSQLHFWIIFIRVIHSSHFLAIFDPFLISFSIPFSKITDFKMNGKMTISEKSNPSLAFAKMIIFPFNFPSHFFFLSNSTPSHYKPDDMWHEYTFVYCQQHNNNNRCCSEHPLLPKVSKFVIKFMSSG